MLSLHNITCKMGFKPLLDNASATIQYGWRVGIVGPNGAGKSTLIKMIVGEVLPEGGEVELGEKFTMGYVRQDIAASDDPILDVVLAADKERMALLLSLEHDPDPMQVAEIHDRLQQIEAYSAPARAATILSGLGFSQDDLEKPIKSFSGGWRMRVALAAVLFQEPDLLLLDEPTNHLDLEAIIWLQNYLANYPHTALIISHDRELLNTCTDHILHFEQQDLHLYTGNYDQFERERAEKRGLQQKMHEKQQAEIAHMQKFIDRFRYKASKARQAQARIKMIERMDLVDAVIAERSVEFHFPQPEEIPPPLMNIADVDVGYDGMPVLKGIDERIDMDDRIALLGANGNGKSTLIKLLAGKLKPLAGGVHASQRLRIGYFAQHQTEELDLDLTPFEAMGQLMRDPEAGVRSRLGQFGFSKSLQDSKISTLSGGEKARLLFALMTVYAPHLLLLDEPTNHLDMESREALIRALNEYEGAVIIVSHDPHLIDLVADRLWLVEEGGCKPFEGDLADYRRHILDVRKAEKAPKEDEKPKQKKVSKQQLRAEAAKKRKAHAHLYRRVEDADKLLTKLSKKKTDLEAQMADPAFYEDTSALQDAQFTYGQLLKEIELAEAEWLEAQEVFDAAEVV